MKIVRGDHMRVLFKRYSSKNKESGFTLIEIILVVLLLSVIVGSVVPDLRKNYRKVCLQNAARNIAYSMRYAQSRAITSGDLVRLELAPESGSYRLTERKEDAIDRDDATFVRIPNRMGNVFRIPDGLKFEPGDLTILFYPDGSMEKQAVKLCGEAGCLLISTREQRGHVNVLEFDK